MEAGILEHYLEYLIDSNAGKPIEDLYYPIEFEYEGELYLIHINFFSDKYKCLVPIQGVDI